MLNKLRPVRVQGAKSTPRQVWETLSWGGRLLATPNDYRTHRLYMRGVRRRDALRFLSGPRAKALRPALNPEPEVLENKLEFERHFGGLGLPVPPTLAVISTEADPHGRLTLTSARQVRDFVLDEAQRRGVVVKPAAASQGQGVTVISSVDGQEVVLSTNERMHVEELIETTGEGVWIIQPRLSQHPDLDALNSTSLNTLRLGTFRRRDGSVLILFAVLRLGRVHSQIDTYNQGGYSVRVDPSTGAFAARGYQKAKFALETVDSHADSGVTFAGRSVPFWDRVVDLATSFAREAGRNRFIGWDVASTPDGPVFVEGNHDWDVAHAQIGSKGMLTDEFVALMQNEAGIGFNVQQMPRLRPLAVLRSLAGARR
ncbi:sugar-transfer associated ATP-grasp domain-containing protein [Parenemella sanctibonifatiensis]|uniref:Alpha-L-glutamate ligase-related protein ATP-grasp domain-containing protein n=1 Tax=Parenemella sanctibonifatiensis TaxID=2016505 RepID=A0A255EL96_9ACTN|nr:sugar-transfer associated ATP-grasp domain-containing protein [Parenemella sanctibonifatiensis]OYN92309.1 hypothetical protein CGZ91_02035 [Parenemella sanctibonifatiensis]